MDLDKLVNKKYFYFLGIGGIGMSALARYFNVIGKRVGGYDKTPSKLTSTLMEEGVVVNFDDDDEVIPELFRQRDDVLVVRTPAVPEGNKQLVWFKDNQFDICKRSEILGLITRSEKSICVAGTHGKTTISTMVSHLLRTSSRDCNAFLGGISKNYNTNLLTSAKSELAVIEADEFDRSFHTLQPWIATISSIDADHLDVYGTFEAIKQSFLDFTKLIREDGILIINKAIDFEPIVKPGVKIYTYSLSDSGADYFASDIKCDNGIYTFSLNLPGGEVVSNLQLGVPGLVNLENAIVASASALKAGVTHSELRASLQSFLGVVRRLDVRYRGARTLYIDDYAHHPKEILAVVSSLRDMFPDKKITGVFQPHLFSRTKDFADQFAESLSLLDELILLDIYPARELPIEGVTAKLIFDKVALDKKVLVDIDNVVKELENRAVEVLITMGAGDIDCVVPDIVTLLRNRDQH